MTLCIGGVADGEWVHDDHKMPLLTVRARLGPLPEPTYAEYVSAKAAGFIRHSVYRLVFMQVGARQVALRVEINLSDEQAFEALLRFYNQPEPRT